jgi:DNA-directed RNA polymerase specialized sigma24 family protein
MAQDDPVTLWIRQLSTEGNQGEDAARRLWEQYFHRLVGLARVRLQGRVRRGAADEEDVALSAFDSFCRGAAGGRFAELQDRHGLWRLLMTITARKAERLIRDQRRQKRGGGAVLGESALAAPDLDDDGAVGMTQVLGREPTPALAAQVGEECERLLLALKDEELRSIALWKMAGDTVKEIAVKLDCAPSTVERRLALIRSLWEKEVPA